MSGTLVAFYLLSTLVLVGAIATVTLANPLTGAVCLVGTLFSLAGLFALLQAHFLAAIQILVYAGAIMVLFVFVIMLLNRPEQEEVGLWRSFGTKLLGLAAVTLLGWRLLGLFAGFGRPGPAPDDFGTVRAIGRVLLSDYLFPFEAISLVLLVAIVGAVVVAHPKR